MRYVILSVTIVLSMVFVGMLFMSIQSCRRYNETIQDSTIVRVENVADEATRIGEGKQGVIGSYSPYEIESGYVGYIIGIYH
jgi:hypothetical protein